MKHALVVTTAAAAALLLSGCGGSSTQTQSATSPPTPSASETSHAGDFRRRNGILCGRRTSQPPRPAPHCARPQA